MSKCWLVVIAFRDNLVLLICTSKQDSSPKIINTKGFFVLLMNTKVMLKRVVSNGKYGNLYRR